MRPSDELLRTMAAVPLESSVLDLGCGEGRLTESLLRLGFPVHACDPSAQAVCTTRERVTELIDAETAERCVDTATLDAFNYPDDTFNWVVAAEAERYASTAEELTRLFSVARRVLKPGGWLYVTVPASEADLEGEATSSGDGAPPSDDAPSDPFAIANLDACRSEADLAEAQDPQILREGDAPRVHVIYRRVE